MILIKIAVLCSDCGVITASKGHHCDHCGSTAIYLLSKLINPQPQSDEVRMLERMMKESK